MFMCCTLLFLPCLLSLKWFNPRPWQHFGRFEDTVLSALRLGLSPRNVFVPKCLMQTSQTAGKKKVSKKFPMYVRPGMRKGSSYIIPDCHTNSMPTQFWNDCLSRQDYRENMSCKYT
eukprot:6255534-Amphidinium_carterae.2